MHLSLCAILRPSLHNVRFSMSDSTITLTRFDHRTGVVFSLVWPPSLPVPRSKCIGWYLHGMSCFSAQYIASHVTLSRRSKYTHRTIAATIHIQTPVMTTYEVRNVGPALLVFHVSELAGALFSGKDTLSAAKFNGVCDIFDVPHAVFVFG